MGGSSVKDAEHDWAVRGAQGLEAFRLVENVLAGEAMSEKRMFASLAWSAKGKVTRRERFLAEMDAVIPWSRLLGLPHYPRATVGRPPHTMETMLRIYFLQHWFDLSDPAATTAGSRSKRSLDLGRTQPTIPSAKSLRSLPERFA
jgi:hypothetical protein